MMFDSLFRGKRNDRRSLEVASVSEYESRALVALDRNALDYFRCGAGAELTTRLNRSRYEQIRIRPRCLARVGNRSLSVNVLGLSYRMPIGIGPVALQKLVHNDCERAMARAARSMGVPFVLSVLSSVSIEDIADVIPNHPKWFQLFILKDRELTENLVRRAEKARYRALVVTVDTPVIGLRRSEMKNPLILPSKVSYANFCPPHNNVCTKNTAEYVKNQFDPTIGWDSLRWLVSITNLPVIVKGILTKEDALMAANLGVKGVIVSNHGGRQLDCAPATIEVLPEVCEAVGSRLIVMTDGGITQGTDVFKALALGAKLVFVGRAAMWGLAVNGQYGVEDVLELLKVELDSVMAMAGCKTINQICENHVRFESEYLAPRLRFEEKRIINQIDSNNRVDTDSDIENGKKVFVESVKVIPQPEKVILIPTGEDGLSKNPNGEDGVDECGRKTSKWCKTVNSNVEIIRAPPRITREVRVVPELAKVFQRNPNLGSNNRQLRIRQSRSRAASMHNLIGISKHGEDCRYML
ncbi:2-Hydroxyacid oxidase 1-like [Malaya genurostris]|uniref:2-Hydroxyacid oxidase 1-like n=1 Tax=Malaya genurostris TaxID=325434 RepID=UPI0026F3B904|nr:2-Hydroxyacid oxidase 1-like [Malaya genurostris]